MANHSLTYGFDADNGGFFYTGPLGGGADDTRKEWWVEAEGLVGMLELYRFTATALLFRHLPDPGFHRATPGRARRGVVRHAQRGWHAVPQLLPELDVAGGVPQWAGPALCVPETLATLKSPRH